jgi:hypothetical protein
VRLEANLETNLETIPEANPAGAELSFQVCEPQSGPTETVAP